MRKTITSAGTEELGHLEIVGAIIHQLTKNLTPEQIEEAGFSQYYVDHTVGVWPQAAGGVPFNACEFQSKGDPITDLFEDLAAEQKARSTYDNILRLVKDPEVCDPIRFLRKREVVHFQRFGEVLRDAQDRLNSRNFYALNPAFDLPQGPNCDTAPPDVPPVQPIPQPRMTQPVMQQPQIQQPQIQQPRMQQPQIQRPCMQQPKTQQPAAQLAPPPVASRTLSAIKVTPAKNTCEAPSCMNQACPRSKGRTCRILN